MAARYEYDGYGNCTVYNLGNNTVGNINPFRYRGYYYDNESGLYYLNSRYYDSNTGRFISPDQVEYLGENETILGFNLFAYCENDPLNHSDSQGNFKISNRTKILIGSAVILTCGLGWAVSAAAVGSAVVACIFEGAFYGSVLGSLAGTAAGGALSTIFSRIKTGTWKNWKKAFADGASTGFMIGAIVGAIAGATRKGFCFIAGTLVLAELSLVPIEEIEEGDYVYSENPRTGETELREVLQVFVNETYELVHIQIDEEEIVCTPGHKFYTEKYGWVSAENLVNGTEIVTYDGQTVTVTSTWYEKLEEPVKVYNFEVEDYHDYFVGYCQVLTHNKGCRPSAPDHIDFKKIDYHAIKKDFLGNNAKISSFDTYKDKATKTIWLKAKKYNIWVNTELTIEEFLKEYSR